MVGYRVIKVRDRKRRARNWKRKVKAERRRVR
jgi:hypothetical protein